MKDINKSIFLVSLMKRANRLPQLSKKALLTLSAFSLTFLSSSQTYSEDIEIYTGLTGESANFAEQVLKPNLLLVLDTSGSMNFMEPVPNPRPRYDPDETYGDPNDNNVYIYDSNRIYTGMFTDRSNNFCREAEETFAENPQLPEYFDRAVVWQKSPQGAPIVTQQCTSSTPQVFDVDTTDRGEERYVTGFNFVGGATYNIVVESERRDFDVELLFRSDNSDDPDDVDNTPENEAARDDCGDAGGNRRTFRVGSNDPFECTITIPPHVGNDTDIRSLETDVRRRNGRSNEDSDTGFTITVIQELICEDVVTPVDVTGGANWVVNVDPSEVDQIEAIECERDLEEVDEGNGHGSNSSPRPEVYPQLQVPSNTSRAPNYIDVAGNPNRLNWGDDIYVNRFLFPANYHAYLQTTTEEFLGVGVNSTIFDLSDNILINGTTTLDTVEQFCSAREGASEPGIFHNRFVRDREGQIHQCITRMRSLKEATFNLLSTINGVNVGIMHFNGNTGGNLSTGMLDIDVPGNREILIETVLSLASNGSTPLQGTLLEAYRYFAGLPIANETEGRRVLRNDLRLELVNGGASGIRLFIDDNNDNDDGRRVRHYQTPEQILQNGTLVRNPDFFDEDDNDFTRAFERPNNGNIDIRRESNDSLLESNVNVEELFSEPFYELAADFVSDVSRTSGQLANDSFVDSAAVRNVGGTRTYISPIQSECQDNNIILLSDGSPNPSGDNEPTEDVSAIEGFINRTCVGEPGEDNNDPGVCLDELAEAMVTRDVNSDITGENNVFLSTIGFGSSDGLDFLENVSDAGRRPGASEGSQHFTATNAIELTTVFQEIIRDLQRVQGDSFVSPAVAVNAFNRLEFRNDLYFALFEPNDSPRWNGNIKRYTITPQGEIQDVDGDVAVGPNGFFNDNARSFWSDSNDGAVVSEGGFSSNLDSGSRRLYANVSDANDDVILLTENNFLTTVVSEGLNLGAIGTGQLGDTTANITDNANDIIGWTFGRDVAQELGGEATDPNFYVAETLHGSPFVLDFGTVGNPEDIVFAFTNQGLLHAIDGANGEELWSYIADDSLFKNLGDYYNNVADAPHVYGVDGEIAADIVRNPATQQLEKAVLFAGQRRGGSGYFAIDIEDAQSATDPVDKLWSVENLPRMGQSWATPVLSTINFCPVSGDPDSCAPRDVVVISGGYDTQYDSFQDASGNAITVASRAGNVVGNAIYMLDRETGALLWMAGRPGQVVDNVNGVGYYTNNDMQHSFPTEPTMVDADFDGVDDLMFAVDIAGRVWRFDFRGNVDVDTSTTPSDPTDDIIRIDDNDIVAGNNNPNSGNTSANSDNEISAGIIAQLARQGVEQRFYNHLDISLTGRTDDDLARYNIVVGSGYRAHPRALEGDANRIYFVFDRNLQFPQLSTDANGVVTGITYNYVDENSNITSNELDSLGDDPLDSSSVNRHGFHVDLLNTDEKLLNPTITDAGIVIAVSYTPTQDVLLNDADDADDIVCQRDTGSSVLYQIDLSTGESAALNLDSDGISSQPLVIELTEDDGTTSKVLIIGTEAFDFSNPPVIQDGVLISPGGNPSELGEVDRESWWERARSLIQ